MRPAPTIPRPVRQRGRQGPSRPTIQNHRDHRLPIGRLQRRQDWFIRNLLGTPAHPHYLRPHEFLNERFPFRTLQHFQPRLPPNHNGRNPVIRPNYLPRTKPRLPPNNGSNPAVRPEFSPKSQPRVPPNGSTPVVKINNETEPRLTSPHDSENSPVVAPQHELETEPRSSSHQRNEDDPVVKSDSTPTIRHENSSASECNNTPTETIDFQITPTNMSTEHTDNSSVKELDDIAQPEVQTSPPTPSHTQSLPDFLSSFENQPFPSPPPSPPPEFQPLTLIPPQTIPTKKPLSISLTGPWDQPQRAKDPLPPPPGSNSKPSTNKRKRPLATSDRNDYHPYWKRNRVNRP